MAGGATATEAVPAPAAVSGRIPGVDLARALAIVGMLAVHVGPTDAAGTAGTLYALSHGRAAILFALVAGVGVSLLVAARSTSPTRARLTLLWRAAVLLPLGLWLQTLDHRVFVILQDYALLFVVATALIGLADRWLVTLAAASATLGSLGYLWGLVAAPDAFERQATAWGDPLGDLVHGLVLSGPYPLITWLAPFTLGMWLGRRDLHRARLRWWLTGSGAVTAAVVGLLAAALGPVGDAGTAGWGLVASAEPHSQMPLWVVGSTASACLLLGASLLLADRFPRVLWPLVATGQLAFTVYVGHLLALHREHELLTSDAVGPAAGLVLGFTVVAACLATAWRAVLRRGPLELVLRPPWSARALRRARGRHGAA